jgi:cold shock CspA family protein
VQRVKGRSRCSPLRVLAIVWYIIGSGLRRIVSMSGQLETATCQRCGSGFVLTTNFLDLIQRRGGKVIVPLLCPTCFLKTGPLPKQQGKIKWFNPRKRYGFIVTEEGEDAFFHQRQLLADNNVQPREGQVVRFHLHYPVKGPEALNVELVKA